jgi:hypothetical protein
MRNPLLYVLRLVQFNRWFMPFLVASTFAAMMVVVSIEKFPSGFSFEQIPFLAIPVAVMLGFGAMVGGLIVLLPAFMIYTKVERLLRKKMANPALRVSEQGEAKAIPTWLWIQFASNVLVAALGWKTQPSIEGTPIDLGTGAHKFLFEAATFVLGNSRYLGWLTISFEKAMPVFYLVVFVAFLKLEAQNRRLSSELEEVV